MDSIQAKPNNLRLLPLACVALALIGLNAGLYGLLAPQTGPAAAALPAYRLPFAEDFSDPLATETWGLLGGDWEVQEAQLIQLNPLGYDLGITLPVELPADQPYSFSSQVRYLGGTLGGGLMFNLQQLTSRQQSHMLRCNVAEGTLYVIYGYFDDASNFTGQGSIRLDRAPDGDAPFRLGVQVGPETYNITLDGQVLAAEIPLHYHGGGLGLTTSTSQVAFDDLQAAVWEPGADTAAAPAAQVDTASSDTTPPREGDWQLADDFDNPAGSAATWRFFAGDWAFADGVLVQRQPTGFDLGAGYVEAVEDYRYQVRFSHRQGAGGGLLFNMPTPDSRSGAHMVRYFEEGTILAWGYYDASGGFVGQGSAPVPAAGDSLHTLEVTSGPESYTITLDGVAIVESVPLTNPRGYVGLTASESVVAFESIALLPLTASVPQAPPGIEFSTLTGEWVLDSGIMTQLDPTLADYIAGTGVAAERFSISVDILLPDAESHPDAGAGIVFHMAQRDNPASGYMARFGRAGNEIFWGAYDENGVFFGQGGSPLEVTPGTARTLTLIVRQESYDILVDGAAVVTDLPHLQPGGWLGLISYGGPVTFSNFQLSLGGN